MNYLQNARISKKMKKLTLPEKENTKGNAPSSETQEMAMLVVYYSKYFWNFGQIRTPISSWHKSPELNTCLENVLQCLSRLPWPSLSLTTPRECLGPSEESENQTPTGVDDSFSWVQ